MVEWRSLVLDAIEGSLLRVVVYTRRRWLLPFLLVCGLVLAGIAGGWLIGEAGPLALGMLVVGLVYVAWALYDLDFAYLGVIAVITLLPFGSLPFKIGFTPTFLDLALGMLFVAWLLPLAVQEQPQFIGTSVGVAVLAFLLLALVAFVLGLSHGALTTYLIRHFAEIVLSVLLFYLVVNTVRDVQRLRRLMRMFILFASLAALLGVVLYVMPEMLTIRILSALGRFGYPTGPGVIWHIRDDPSLMKRATGTSVHPNVLGSLLNLGLVMLVPQLLAKRPLIPRFLGVALVVVLGSGLVLTISRSAMLGAALAIGVVVALRYPKLLPVLLALLAILAMMPWSRDLTQHFVEGFKGQDLSTKMRLGEYKDTLTLIRRYPVFGVGFSGAPDIDIYVAVASLYLIVAAQVGLVGLSAFLVVMGLVLWRFWRYRSAAEATGDLEPLWYGLHAAVISALISGTFDHFFFSLDFHHSVTLFWLLIGLATAATELVRERTTMPSPDRSPLD